MSLTEAPVSTTTATPRAHTVGMVEDVPLGEGRTFVVAGTINSVYDVVLWRTFRKVELPEEATPRRPSA